MPLRNFCHYALIMAVSSGLYAAPAWVARSNQNAEVLLKTISDFSPEGAGQLGMTGFDDKILDLKPGIYERSQKATEDAKAILEQRLPEEKDPLVKQDLEILIKAADDNYHQAEVGHNRQLPYFNVPQTIFFGIRTLLDDQVAPERRKAALVRLRRYAGLDPGYTPVTLLAEQRTRERMSVPGLLGPSKAEVEKDLSNGPFFIDGIGKLFTKYKLEGYQPAYAKLKEQLTAYEGFVKSDVLPRARADFRLPPDLYRLQLDNYGVDIDPAKLAAEAQAAFTQIQGQMQVVAAKLARERGYPSPDYRDVIRELKKQQITGKAILPFYEHRLAQIEEIIRREHLVTLPDRPARIRLATAAESAQIPAPHMDPPRLIGNAGEKGEFVLPLNVPSKDGKMQNFDDFTFDAAAWTLTAHEARPGHELQFDSMVEHGVSTARAVFTFNSANVEGWGLYSEWILQPYLPLDGQLICLQHRLMRAGRAFLDPELHMGKVTPDQALHVLKHDVVLSDAMANEEVERYMFRSPGQATAYFYGYTRLLEIRKDAEQKLGANFNALRFHDFILAQGLLPPTLMRKQVEDVFIPEESRRASGHSIETPGLQ